MANYGHKFMEGRFLKRWQIMSVFMASKFYGCWQIPKDGTFNGW